MRARAFHSRFPIGICRQSVRGATPRARVAGRVRRLVVSLAELDYWRLRRLREGGWEG